MAEDSGNQPEQPLPPASPSTTESDMSYILLLFRDYIEHVYLNE